METVAVPKTGNAHILRECFRLLRVEQYTKNLIVFLPLFFSLQIGDADLLLRATAAFGAFCMAASAVYVFNDSIDLEEDRNHPVKKRRPLAAGTLSRGFAAVLIPLFALPALAASWLLSPSMLGVVLLYMVVNAAYAWKLKHIPILDIAVIASGFVMRVVVGGVVTGTAIYMWILIMTFLLALFLALAKRRDDVVLFLGTNGKARRAIDSAMMIMAAVTIVAYIMYTVSPDVMMKFGTDKLYVTTVFVILGILRYMQITMVENRSGSPTEVLLRDGFLQLAILGWLATFAFLIYG
jgi:4-hydroxybenzoate polyprenyltransferase